MKVDRRKREGRRGCGDTFTGVPHKSDSAQSAFYILAAQRTPRDGFININQILQMSKLGFKAVKETTGKGEKSLESPSVGP